MTISRTPTGGRGHQGLVVAPSQATRVRLSLVELSSNSGWPTWPKRSPTKRGHPALLDGAVTGSGLKSSNCGKKARTACTIGSATRLSSEAGGSSGYHPDQPGRRHTHRDASFFQRSVAAVCRYIPTGVLGIPDRRTGARYLVCSAFGCQARPHRLTSRLPFSRPIGRLTSWSPFLHCLRGGLSGWRPLLGWSPLLRRLRGGLSGWRPLLGWSPLLRRLRGGLSGWRPLLGWSPLLRRLRGGLSGWRPLLDWSPFLHRLRGGLSGWRPLLGSPLGGLLAWCLAHDGY